MDTENIEEIIIDAFMHGWSLKKMYGAHMLRPPKEFGCDNWAATYKVVNFRGLEFSIPDWIEDADRRRKGAHIYDK